MNFYNYGRYLENLGPQLNYNLGILNKECDSCEGEPKGNRSAQGSFPVPAYIRYWGFLEGRDQLGCGSCWVARQQQAEAPYSLTNQRLVYPLRTADIAMALGLQPINSQSNGGGRGSIVGPQCRRLLQHCAAPINPWKTQTTGSRPCSNAIFSKYTTHRRGFPTVCMHARAIRGAATTVLPLLLLTKRVEPAAAANVKQETCAGLDNEKWCRTSGARLSAWYRKLSKAP